ncbi:MAG: ROK family protein [Lachnospiraceae bacterium]
MKRSVNNIEVKKMNRNRVFRYVNSRTKTSMPDISTALDMSGPTVLTIINELKEAHVVQEVGELRSTGGRKAKAIASVQDMCYAVGLDITRNHVSLALTNFSEKTLKHIRIRKPFVYEDNYFAEVGEIVNQFIEESVIPQERIVGVGISVPGLVDPIQNKVFFSGALGLEACDIGCDEYAKYLPYPCTLLNDANAAVCTECVNSVHFGSMVYLSLSNTVGGAIVFQSESDRFNVSVGIEPVSIFMGNNWRGGEFGHMTIHPEGIKCYCGKKGCLDTYCSALKLADMADGNLGDFFERVEAGNPQFKLAWETYLDDLLIAVDNLRMCFDCDVVLGGYVGSYMEPYILKFQRKVAEKNIFENDGKYVRACKYQVEASALGAAIYQIEKYVDTI